MGDALTYEAAGYRMHPALLDACLQTVAADSQPTVVPEQLGDAGFSVAAMAEGEDGEIYLVNYSGGTIHRLIED